METTVLGILLLGIVIGLQHALEADHIAAVSSIVSGETSLKRIISHGTLWGIGHTIMLAAVAGSAIFLGAALDQGVASWLEFGVGIMLALLGGHVLWRLIRDRIHFHTHSHQDGTVHLHAHSHAGEVAPHNPKRHQHGHPEGLPWRTLFVGIMHGLAGSAALVVLTASQVADPVIGIAYVVLFGVGSIFGMAALSAVIAVPLRFTAKSLTWLNRGLQGVVGGVTVVLGFVVMYETQIANWLQ